MVRYAVKQINLTNPHGGKYGTPSENRTHSNYLFVSHYNTGCTSCHLQSRAEFRKFGTPSENRTLYIYLLSWLTNIYTTVIYKAEMSLGYWQKSGTPGEIRTHYQWSVCMQGGSILAFFVINPYSN